MELPFVGPSYHLESRPSGVQRTINMVPVPEEPGNERTAWVFKDVPGLTVFNSPVSPPSELAIGWLEPIDSTEGVAAHANNGTAFFTNPNAALNIPTLVYAGMVDFIGAGEPTVEWSQIWTPVLGDAQPFITSLGNGKVSVNFDPSTEGARQGMLVLTATINGVPIAVGQRLVFTCDPALDPPDLGYGPVAWGPES